MFAAPGQPGTLVGAWRSLVSAPDWGSGGRWFESSRPDHTFPPSRKRVLIIACALSRRGAASTAETETDALSSCLQSLLASRACALRRATARFGDVVLVDDAQAVTRERALRHIAHDKTCTRSSERLPIVSTSQCLNDAP